MAQVFPGVILAGGRSLRMGQAKALLPFGPARLIDHVADRLAPQVASLTINANDPAIRRGDTPVFPDSFADFPGPLAGICAALEHASRATATSHVAIVTVDTPFFPQGLVARLARAIAAPGDIALAASGGRMHPVTGLWPLAALADLRRWLENPPTLRVRAFLENRPHQIVAFVPPPTSAGEIDPFFNINTPDDLRTALLHLGQSTGAA